MLPGFPFHYDRLAPVRGALWALLLGLATTVAADPDGELGDDGHLLAHRCRLALRQSDPAVRLDPAEQLAAARCRAYLQGMTELVAISHPLKPEAQPFCPPPGGMDLERALRAVVRYLDAHPERLDARMVTLATAALIGEFPCPSLIEYGRRRAAPAPR